MSADSLEIGHRSVDEASVTAFGSLTGDYARMHFDRDPARPTVVHGLLGAAWALGALTQHVPERLGLGRTDVRPDAFSVRFRQPVHIGDRFALRIHAEAEPLEAGPNEVAFEAVNQHGATTGTGAVSVAVGRDAQAPPLPAPPRRLDVEPPMHPPDAGDTLFAEDLPERGPRGIGFGRTVTEADLVAWTGFTGALDPFSLDAELARTGPFGARIAPPMWTFCLAFGHFLRALLRAPLPDAGFAGHLGDSWRFLAPVFVGDTLRARHRPVSCTPSKSRPALGIVHFALQLENQREEIVQDGEVVMMVPRRA